MTATERLRELLDARGVKHYHEPNYVKWDDANQHQCFAFETYERPGLLRVHCNLTPEQAIAATLGSGMLTADDVRDSIERHSDPSGGNGRDFRNGAYEAIADELNATITSRAERTCHAESDLSEWVCSACQCWIPLGLTPENIKHASEWRYCPHCGAKVKAVSDDER